MRLITPVLLLVLLAALLPAQAPQSLSDEYAALTAQYSQRQKTIQSREEYQKFVADRQRDLEALLAKHQADAAVAATQLSRGRILGDLRKFAEAEAVFVALLEPAGATADAARFEQVKLRLAQEQAAAALPIYRTIEARLKPGPELYEVWLGFAFGADEAAVREEFSRRFLAATELPAEYARYRSEVIGNLADVLAEKGDRAGAVKVLEQGIAAAQDPAQAKRLQGALRQLQLVGQPALPIAAETWVNSAPLALADLKGKVVVIDFWAPWCGPCRQVMPHLVRFHKELAAQGLVVIGFTKLYGRYSDDVENKGKVEAAEELPLIKGFVARHQLPYPVAVSNSGKEFADYGISGIPTLIVIGRDGNVAEVKIGSGNEEKLEATIKKLLAQK